MRKIEHHYATALNEKIDVVAVGDRGLGGANNEYLLRMPGVDDCRLVFQNGPVGEAGWNGYSNEAVLAVVLDRLEGFAGGSFSCRETVLATKLVRAALEVLKSRTSRRVRAGTEGTMQEADSSYQIQVRREGNRVVIVTDGDLAASVMAAMSAPISD